MICNVISMSCHELPCSKARLTVLSAHGSQPPTITMTIGIKSCSLISAKRGKSGLQRAIQVLPFLLGVECLNEPLSLLFTHARRNKHKKGYKLPPEFISPGESSCSIEERALNPVEYKTVQITEQVSLLMNRTERSILIPRLSFPQLTLINAVSGKVRNSKRLSGYPLIKEKPLFDLEHHCFAFALLQLLSAPQPDHNVQGIQWRKWNVK